MRKFLFCLLCLPVFVKAQNLLPALGQWREHLPYGSAIDLTYSDNNVFVATPYSIFSYNRSSGEISRYSKVSGLSETGVSAIAFQNGRLIIAYTTGNVDIMDSKGIHNIPDIKRDNIAGDKTIYDIYTEGSLAYLSTGLGVIALNLDRLEVKDSWFIGNSGGNVRVHSFTRHNGFYYAATNEGLLRVPVSGSNPANFNNWQRFFGLNGLPAAPARDLASVNNNLFVLSRDSVFMSSGGNYNFIYSDGYQVNNLEVSNGVVILTETKPTGENRTVVLNPDGSLKTIITQPGLTGFPRSAIFLNNEYWIADQYAGLIRWSGNSGELIQVNSPRDLALGAFAAKDDKVYISAGSVNAAWQYQYNRNGIYMLENGQWNNINQFNTPGLDSVLDFISMAIDPRDGSLWAGSFGGGLLHRKADGSTELFKYNTGLSAPAADPGSFRVAGLAFDADNNLWMTNFGSASQLVVLKNDGTWKSFTAPFTLNENAAANLVIDEGGNKWFISPLGNGLIAFTDKNTIDNPADDQWLFYRLGNGQGNLPSNFVSALALDRSGFVWVGTNDGIGVIQCAPDVFFSPCQAVLPIIRENGFSNYIFKGQEVRAIAVDGGDRKWVATASGVYLMSPDGDSVLSRFTEANSPLLSDDVRNIGINGKTGEVYFLTAKGISSFRGAATAASESDGNVLVFPNPVPPGFNGQIGIRGLPDNSFVKITELNGRLVYQTRANGGQAVWNGRDYRGNKASSGIYLVIAISEDRQEKMVGKIVLASN